MASSRILVIGGTGRIGRHLVAASLNAGHPTAVLVRPATAGAGADDPVRAKLLEELHNHGARIVNGDIKDHESLVAAMEHADVVISAVGHTSPEEVESQLKIMRAIQDTGNVKRFVPSEYGCNLELADQMLEPARSILGAKLRVREALRASEIPHTIICSYWNHGFLLPKAGDPEADGPPVTRVTIFGDAMFVNEKDMSTVTIKAVDDPRTLNKVLHVRPPANLCSLHQLVSLWERKIGKNLEKCYILEEELTRKVQTSPFPLNFQLAMVHSTLLAGVPSAACEQITVGGDDASDNCNDNEVEATELYPSMNYVSVEEYINGLIV
uniref:NmrA-like domain-containing protein n=1 Tax=Oryza punctata TaxID=4537 RepID=A0A0E0JG52_ORYPU